jgi:hypothetical protein
MDSATEAPKVTAALTLGWRLAELYSHELPGPPDRSDPAKLPKHLPGLGELGSHDQAVLLLDQAKTELDALQLKEVPLDPVISALKTQHRDTDPIRFLILGCHNAIRKQLATGEAQLSIAYGLGRALADTCLLPNVGSKDKVKVAANGGSKATLDEADTRNRLKTEFAHFRVLQLQGWLDDLRRALPAKAAAAVSISLGLWADRVNSSLSRAEWKQLVDSRRRHHQREIWRRLLVGQKTPSSLLKPADYAFAAKRMLGHVNALIRDFARRAWPFILAVFACAFSLGWFLLVKTPSDSTTRAAAFVVAGAGFFGATWKSISATLGKTIGQAWTNI